MLTISWEKRLTWALVTWALVLHLTFFVSAGALWRDEANSIQQASLGSWPELWNSLEDDSFPILYPSLLRLFFSPTASDTGLRFFGLLTGVSILLSLWFVPRLLEARFPVVVLAFAAVNPGMIIEGDSLRPYGVSILCLLWTFGLLGKYLLRPAPVYLILATLLAVLSVQTSYTNSLFVGLFAFCAGWVLVSTGQAGRLWRIVIPPAVAALSLLPYLAVLQRAQDWVVIVSDRVDWGQVARTGIQAYGPASIFLVLASLAFAIWAIWPASKERTRRAGSPVILYAALVAGLGLLMQVGFFLLLRLPAFPRYFLPCLVLASIGCELMLRANLLRLRTLVVVATLLSIVWPAWNAVRLRRTNVDAVAQVLNEQARPEDLIVISPWFLSISFQRYYRGPARWITVPDIEHSSITRYRLIKQAMIFDDAGKKVAERIQQTLASGGMIWYVSQRLVNDIREAPIAPVVSAHPDGSDYVRFRGFWERDIQYRLESRSVRAPVSLPDAQSTWQGERLILTRWTEESKQ